MRPGFRVLLATLVMLSMIALVGCSVTKTQTALLLCSDCGAEISRSTKNVTLSRAEAQTFVATVEDRSGLCTDCPKRSVKIIVWDDTERNPLDLEIWMRGVGSWYPDLKYGGDTKTVGPFRVDVPIEMYIYPDGRSGSEVALSITLTRDMTSGSDKYAVHIELSDSEVVVLGQVVPDIEQKYPR